MYQFNRILFSLISFTVVCFVVYKILYVPITHDETATTVHYINFTNWEIMMYPDNWPNNHILNTLTTKLAIFLGGKEQWVVRLPNLMGFLLFLLGIFRLTKNILKSGSIWVIATLSIFVSNSYLLDFFGLCRGYGMASGIMTLSISYIISGYKLNKEKDIWVGIILATLSSYASFTLLHTWIAILIVSGLYIFQRNRLHTSRLLTKMTYLVSLSVGYGLLIYTPIKKMTSTNQFQYWESNSFFKDTIISLATNWKYGNLGINVFSPTHLALFSLLVILAGLILLILQIKQKGFKEVFSYSPLLIIFAILLLTISINQLQSWLLKTPNLTNRTALHFYPLFYIYVLGIFHIFDRKNSITKKIFAVIVPIFFLWHLGRTISFDSVREWWFDKNTTEVIDYLAKKEPEGDIRLKTNWLFHPSFHFYTYTDNAPEIILYAYDKQISDTTNATYYYIQGGDYDQLKEKFEKEKEFDFGMWLLKRKELSAE